MELFDALGIRRELVDALKAEKITVPTEIQRKVIPEAIKNLDLMAQSQTGTGKTLAYLLPLFEKINPEIREMQAMVLVPTHELAIQIIRQIERLAANSGMKTSAAPIIGNVNIERQIEKLKEKPHILVGSPGRILELIKKRKITAHTIKTIVLDEGDRLMDDHHLESVKAVIKSTLKDRQLLMFSATMPKDAVEKAKLLMKEPTLIRAEEQVSIPSGISHMYFVTEQREKIEVLRKLVRSLEPQKAIVFVNQGEEIEIFTEKLKYHGLKAEALHGANIKLDRKKTMDLFRTGKIQLLIASDIAARGLHLEGVTHIFNIHVPEDEKDYLHRAGRTGRNGSTGMVLSIVTEKELSRIKKFEKSFKIVIQPKKLYKGEVLDAKGTSEAGPAT